MADSAISVTFKVTRVLQTVCMIAIIGLTSNFVSEIVQVNASVPSVLIGTLVVVCSAVLYCIITFILFLDNVLPLLIATVVDLVNLIALIIVSVRVGAPLPSINCSVVDELFRIKTGGADSTGLLASALTVGGKVFYSDWAQISKSTCLETKSIWGLCIALCILFTISSTAALFLWKQSKKSKALTKGEA